MQCQVHTIQFYSHIICYTPKQEQTSFNVRIIFGKVYGNYNLGGFFFAFSYKGPVSVQQNHFMRSQDARIDCTLSCATSGPKMAPATT